MKRKRIVSLAAFAIIVALSLSCGGSSDGGLFVPTGKVRLEATSTFSPVLITWTVGQQGALLPISRNSPWSVEVDAASSDAVHIEVCNQNTTSADVVVVARVVWKNSVVAEQTGTGHGSPRLICDPDVVVDMTLP